MDYITYGQRLEYLLELIEKGRLSNKEVAANSFGCSIRTITRMLNHLRDRGHDIRYSSHLKKFYIEN